MTTGYDICRALIKRIDDLLHDDNTEAAHVEMHELAHQFEQCVTSTPRTCATCHAVLADGPQPAATYAPPAVMTGWAAWHHTKGFDGHHYEGPVVFADLDEALLADIADLNESEPYGKRTSWKAVKVEVRKVP